MKCLSPLKIFLSLLLVYPALVIAQPSGKIAGTVSDGQTGDPIAGVNVVLKNALLGASTDLDGRFVILNVKPGTHIVEFSFIGYQTVDVQNVEVKIDRTTKVDIELQPATLTLDEAVVVTADRPIVEADKTASSVHIEAEEIQALPVEGLRNILELTAGINRNADGTISIRGGGAYEINYVVDGVTSYTTNTGIPAYGTGTKADNHWKYDVNPLAVAQMEVIAGGFNAEYGNAQSGVVKVVTKEGSQSFTGAFQMEYRPPGQYHWGDYLYSKSQPEWQQWGNLGAWYNAYTDDTTGVTDSTLAEINHGLWITNHTPADDNILGVYDYRKNAYTRYSFSFGGPLGRDARLMNFFFAGELLNRPTRLPTREKVQEKQSFTLNLAFKPNEKNHLKLRGKYQFYRSGMGSGSEDIRYSGLWGSYGARRKYTLIYDSPREETITAQNLEYNYVFSSRSYLETKLTHQTETLYALQTPTPGTDRDRQLHPDPADRLLEDTGVWLKGSLKEYRDYYTWSSLYNQASVTDIYDFSSNFSAQLTNTNLLKAGLKFWLMDQDYNASSSLSVSAYVWRTGFATNYKAKTWYGAAYIQDKLEFAGMIANVGLRYDAYNFGVDVPADKYDFFYPADGISYPGNPEWKDSNTFESISPRVGLSFPIGERTAFRVQYGHFRSMPIINRALDNQTFNGWNSYGNPNLKPKLSVNYEFGVQQNLWDTHQLDIVTYYNDLKDQVSVKYIRSATGSQSRAGDLEGTYLTYDNNGYGNSRGIEISFKNRMVTDWRYSLTYTLSQTNIGYHGTFLDDPSLTANLEKYLYGGSDFLAPEDRTHRFNGSLTYIVSDDGGPGLFGFKPFSNTSVGLIYRLMSGLAYYYSPEFQYEFKVESNRRYPMESQTDLRIDKSIRLGSYDFKLGVRVLNLLDNKHFTPFSNSEEMERWVLRSVTYMNDDYDYQGKKIDRPATVYNYFQTFKNIPRQIFFKVGVSF